MEERKKRDWGKIAALLCVLLLAVNLWQGQRLENLERQISEARRKLSAEIGGLESSFYAQAQEADKLVWNWEYIPSLNMEKRRLDVEVSAVLKEWREDTAVELFWFAENGGGEGDSLPLFGGGTGTFTGTLELPLDNPSMEISLYAVIQNGGSQRRESLGLLGGVWELLPLWCEAQAGQTQAEYLKGVFTAYECSAKLYTKLYPGPVVAEDCVFRLRRNNELVAEQAAEPGERSSSYFCGKLSAEAQPGDRMDLTFFCRDENGLGYEFLLQGWIAVEERDVFNNTSSWENVPKLTWD